MRKMKIVLGVLVSVFVMCGMVMAQENMVNQNVIYLKIGTNNLTVSGTSTNLLESLYYHTYAPGVTNNISGVTGNLPIAAATNMLPSAGSYIGGNIPKAAISNALGTAGNTIGGNIPAAALTNAVSGATMFGSLPASTNGLVTGQLWNNSGALSIKP